MHDTEGVIEHVRTAFRDVPFPGDAFLQGSFDGGEPYDEVRQFHGRTSWTALTAELLDARYGALSFLSEAGFRFFLPAWLVADLRGELRTADPVFHLTHGLHAVAHEHRVGDRTFVRRSGPRVLLNPRRYGAMTWGDHVRQRLSVFTREEAAAIVAYLRHRQARPADEEERDRIEQALGAYWLERARTAPTAAELAAHLAEEQAFAAAIEAQVAARRAAAPPPPPAAPDPTG